MADLDTLLASAPAGSKDAAAKTAHADQVFQALTRSPTENRRDHRRDDARHGDVLLKYVYGGLKHPGRTALWRQAKLADKIWFARRVLSDELCNCITVIPLLTVVSRPAAQSRASSDEKGPVEARQVVVAPGEGAPS